MDTGEIVTQGGLGLQQSLQFDVAMATQVKPADLAFSLMQPPQSLLRGQRRVLFCPLLL